MVMVRIRERNIEYLEGKNKELEINSKNQYIIHLCRGLKELKESYQL